MNFGCVITLMRMNMSNPVLVEVMRGALVESRHRGAVAVADADGTTVLAIGDVTTPVFPRSAVKALQALALMEAGAADRYGFGDEELALACASHSGEPAHVAGVERMLAKAGLDSSALRCGTHWPISQRGGVCAGAHRRSRRRCITTAPASTRAFCAPPARWASITPAIGGRNIRCSARCAPCSKMSRAPCWRGSLRHRRLLGSDLGGAAGKSCPRLCQIRHRPRSCARRAPRPPRGCATPARKNPGTSPAPAGSAPRSCSCSARGFS